MRNHVLVIQVILFSVILFGSCASVEKDFYKARSYDTIQAYKEFLVKHPLSEFSKVVTERIEYLELDKARKEDTIEAYQRFLSKYPQSKFCQEAVELSDWKKVTATNTIKGYQSYLLRYPGGQFEQEAKDRLEKLNWHLAEKTDTMEAYSVFLSEYPTSKFANIAKEKIEEFEFERVKKASSLRACMSYLEKYPKGKDAPEVVRLALKLWEREGNYENLTKILSMTLKETKIDSEVLLPTINIEKRNIFDDIPFEGGKVTWSAKCHYFPEDEINLRTEIVNGRLDFQAYLKSINVKELLAFSIPKSHRKRQTSPKQGLTLNIYPTSLLWVVKVRVLQGNDIEVSFRDGECDAEDVFRAEKYNFIPQNGRLPLFVLNGQLRPRSGVYIAKKLNGSYHWKLQKQPESR